MSEIDASRVTRPCKIEWYVIIMMVICSGSMLFSDFASASVLISFGVILGTTSPLQLIVMTLIEIVLFTVNEVIGRKYLGVSNYIQRWKTYSHCPIRLSTLVIPSLCTCSALTLGLLCPGCFTPGTLKITRSKHRDTHRISSRWQVALNLPDKSYCYERCFECNT